MDTNHRHSTRGVEIPEQSHSHIPKKLLFIAIFQQNSFPISILHNTITISIFHFIPQFIWHGPKINEFELSVHSAQQFINIIDGRIYYTLYGIIKSINKKIPLLDHSYCYTCSLKRSQEENEQRKRDR